MKRRVVRWSDGSRLLVGMVIAAVALGVAGFAWARSLSAPREAPEAEAVLRAQIDLPFQVLIPAYLPRVVDRARAQIDTSQPGPNGEPMIRLVYPLRVRGVTLELREWLPAGAVVSAGAQAAQGLQSETPGGPQSEALGGVQIVACRCQTLPQSEALSGSQSEAPNGPQSETPGGVQNDALGGSNNECMMSEMELSVDGLRVVIRVSAPNILAMQQIQAVYNTLGPAANRQQIYSSAREVPVTFSVPEAVDIPINEQGIQVVDLIVTPNGYDPVHFAVRKGVPVRLIFRQLGYVSCGNELIFQWGKKQTKTLLLETPDDKETLEFTPTEAGDFPFHCPHYIYRGVMTVRE